MDGITVLERLRAEPRTAALKVVALTMKGDRERLLAEGFDGYLEKPISYKEFLNPAHHGRHGTKWKRYARARTGNRTG